MTRFYAATMVLLSWTAIGLSYQGGTQINLSGLAKARGDYARLSEMVIQHDPNLEKDVLAGKGKNLTKRVTDAQKLMGDYNNAKVAYYREMESSVQTQKQELVKVSSSRLSSDSAMSSATQTRDMLLRDLSIVRTRQATIDKQLAELQRLGKTQDKEFIRLREDKERLKSEAESLEAFRKEMNSFIGELTGVSQDTAAFRQHIQSAITSTEEISAQYRKQVQAAEQEAKHWDNFYKELMAVASSSSKKEKPTSSSAPPSDNVARTTSAATGGLPAETQVVRTPPANPAPKPEQPPNPQPSTTQRDLLGTWRDGTMAWILDLQGGVIRPAGKAEVKLRLKCGSGDCARFGPEGPGECEIDLEYSQKDDAIKVRALKKCSDSLGVGLQVGALLRRDGQPSSPATPLARRDNPKRQAKRGNGKK